MANEFGIKANVFGKIKYWDHINGLHSGKCKLKGHQVFKTKKEAENIIKYLKKVYYSVITFSVIESKEFPFIKKQLRKNKQIIKK